MRGLNATHRLTAAVVLATSFVLGPGHETPGAQTIPSAPKNVRIFSGSATAPSVSVSISPGNSTIEPGAIVQFVATVAGSTNQSVTWKASGGTITTAGRYTAGSTSGTYGVTATITGGSVSGSTNVTISSSSSGYVNISPGESIQAKIDANPNGTAFRLRSGVHRLTAAIVPKSNQTFVGETGASISGARLLTSFSRSGSAWIATGQTQEGQVGGECKASSPRCNRPEDLFINDVPLQHVASVSAGGPGKWYFDYGANTIYFWDDPNGKRVETSVTSAAINGFASGVTLRGLIVEKFATPTQRAAVNGGAGWLVEGNEFRLNHSRGLNMADGRRVINNRFYRNGQLGLGGSSRDGLVEGNEISYNNFAGFNDYWEGGGSKFTFSRNLMIRKNHAHHNYGPGLWTDIDNIYVTYEDNLSEYNERAGIFHEISFDAVIRNNVVRYNGTVKPFTYWVEGSGIAVTTSKNVEVYGNTVLDNWQGITVIDDHRGSSGTGMGVYETRNVRVRNNRITLTSHPGTGGGRTGLHDTAGTGGPAYSGGNTFEGNIYVLPSNGMRYFFHKGERTDSEWYGVGFDSNTGSISRQ